MLRFTGKKKNQNEPIQIAEVHDIVAFQHNLESYESWNSSSILEYLALLQDSTYVPSFLSRNSE